MTPTPKRLGRAGDSGGVIGHLDGVPVVKVEDPNPRKVIKLVNSNGPEGNYIEFEDGERVDLTEAQWRVELTCLLRNRNGKVDETKAGSVG